MSLTERTFPAEQFGRNCSLKCRHWADIVSQTLFCSFSDVFDRHCSVNNLCQCGRGFRVTRGKNMSKWWTNMSRMSSERWKIREKIQYPFSETMDGGLKRLLGLSLTWRFVVVTVSYYQLLNFANCWYFINGPMLNKYITEVRLRFHFCVRCRIKNNKRGVYESNNTTLP